MPLLAGFRRPWSTPCPALCPQVARRLERGMPTPETGAPGRGGWALSPRYRTRSCPVRAVVFAARLLGQPLSRRGGEDTRPVLPLLLRCVTRRPSFSVSLRQSFWLRVRLSTSLPPSLSPSSFLLQAPSGPPPSSLSFPLLCYISLYLLRSPPLLLCPPPPPLLPRSLPPQPLRFLSALQLLFLPFLPPPPHPLLPFQWEASRNRHTHTHAHALAHMLLSPAPSRGLPH